MMQKKAPDKVPYDIVFGGGKFYEKYITGINGAAFCCVCTQ
jgi:hypothetical protein